MHAQTNTRTHTIVSPHQHRRFVKEAGRFRVLFERPRQVSLPFCDLSVRRRRVGLFRHVHQCAAGLLLLLQQDGQNVRAAAVFEVAVIVVRVITTTTAKGLGILRRVVVIVQPNVHFVFVRDIDVGKINHFGIVVVVIHPYSGC